jgi:hypothetical protein
VRADDAEYILGVSGKDRARCHVQEKMEKDLDHMQELEETLGIVERWTTESPKWTATVEDIKRCNYNIALNTLELLIVERIFELKKMNQSQTGTWREALIIIGTDRGCRVQNAEAHCQGLAGSLEGRQEHY